MIEELLEMLPPSYKEEIESLENIDEIQEIRIRIGRPLEVVRRHVPLFLPPVGTREAIDQIVGRATHFSVYRFQDDIKKGFLTVKGGHRIGLSGEAVATGEKISNIEPVSFLNIRVAREARVRQQAWMETLLSKRRLLNTVIVGPPYSGKTTILRQLTKWLSDDRSAGFKVSMIDERSELAACYQGLPQLDVGKRTDVLDRCPKSEGISLMIRSMSPEVIVVDEVDGEEDTMALKRAIGAGVSVLCTTHADDWEGLEYRLGSLFPYMERFVFLPRLNQNHRSLVIYQNTYEEVKRVDLL
ncbi:ATPase, T2SS/T4P/T4SS family [Salimicrobium halophilum]|uniref:Stage III sporulation protein AA n=1 Tax=Salimicrobium halophilum TaxID=86666 RepID=A0A1G8PU40_9BACI|nr:ATPase, T2SS/T4P/T4SS family [Salimicrobium halophilum]SDI96024.1 stage III sporulation protein AA [Salimicrobium halophilum]